jgi:hypothetical protein
VTCAAAWHCQAPDGGGYSLALSRGAMTRKKGAALDSGVDEGAQRCSDDWPAWLGKLHSAMRTVRQLGWRRWRSCSCGRRGVRRSATGARGGADGDSPRRGNNGFPLPHDGQLRRPARLQAAASRHREKVGRRFGPSGV